MKSLKLSKKNKEEISACAEVCDAPEYPYGARISLKEEQIAQFPELQKVAVGDEMDAVIRVRVKSISENASEDGEKKNHSQRVELQITDMEFGKDTAAEADELYPTMKEKKK